MGNKEEEVRKKRKGSRARIKEDGKERYKQEGLGSKRAKEVRRWMRKVNCKRLGEK